MCEVPDLATGRRAVTPEWQPPGRGDGIPADKPAYFDEMVEAAAAATRACIAQGYTHGDIVTKNSAWYAADAVRKKYEG